MRKVFVPPPQTGSSLVASAAALVLTTLLFFILPLTQMLSPSGARRPITLSVDLSPPPPPPPPPPRLPPPPEEKQKERKPKLSEAPKPLTLQQLELALNPGMGAAVQGSFGLILDLADARPDTKTETRFFELSELDRRPEPVYAPLPPVPIRLARDKIRAIAMLKLLIDDKGVVCSVELQQGSTYAEWDRACLETVAKWRFKPAVKNGQAVAVRCLQPLECEPPP